ncbi:unnamed protein product [Caenorhabditis sp. 36 PRJEB53466]|nr:unnamed protein product [Caenorhabditis sp. 36 PRJEB53466]
MTPALTTKNDLTEVDADFILLGFVAFVLFVVFCYTMIRRFVFKMNWTESAQLYPNKIEEEPNDAATEFSPPPHARFDGLPSRSAQPLLRLPHFEPTDMIQSDPPVFKELLNLLPPADSTPAANAFVVSDMISYTIIAGLCFLLLIICSLISFFFVPAHHWLVNNCFLKVDAADQAEDAVEVAECSWGAPEVEEFVERLQKLADPHDNDIPREDDPLPPV